VILLPPKTVKGKVRKALTGDGRKKPKKFFKNNVKEALGKSGSKKRKK
jgi:hypothetical protein